MHQAFVQDAKDDVNREQGGKNQNGLSTERLLVSLQSAGEKTANRGRNTHFLFQLIDGNGRVAQCGTGREVERNGDRREQTGVI